MIRIIGHKAVGAILQRRQARMEEAEAVVRPIIDSVRKRGDKALVEYARRFDGLKGAGVAVSRAERESAYARMPGPLRVAIRKASRNIRAYSEMQLPRRRERSLAPGLRVSHLVQPLDSMAAYIPGGRHPLLSTMLMTVIPAQAAGVPTISVACPKPDPCILGTARHLCVQNLFRMGGAHAIAAFAYGTRTVPRADRIVGPGNIYVAAAKKLLAGEVGIDFIAGPTEILIIASDGNPQWLAADMLAQAEHDVDASAVLLTTSRKLALAVAAEIERQLATLPTAGTARQAIDRNSAIVLVRTLGDALEISNRFAPEHLSIPNRHLLPAVRNAGSIFVGPTSPEAAGDYASGPNHVLPTNGLARLRGGLSAMDFVKVISVQELSAGALRNLAPAITTLARAEGLEAHARSVEARFA
jgi:histidinol dehydrogenase